MVLLVDKVWLDSIHGSIRRKMKIGNASMQIKDMVFPKETAKKQFCSYRLGWTPDRLKVSREKERLMEAPQSQKTPLEEGMELFIHRR